MKKRICLVGSTGSIGTQVIEVVKSYPRKFEIVAMAGGENETLFTQQMEEVKPTYVAMMKCQNPNIPQGEEEIERLCALPEVDIVIVAVSGFSGLAYSLAAIRAGKRLALANKETLVCGGELIMQEKMNGEIIPIDSEHSAIWQCLNFKAKTPAKRLYITASGGPFRGWLWEELLNVKPDEAIKHPNWRMGKKISIDSATMLNKAFEIVEAHHLYQIPYERIIPVIHPTSTVHSMVEFADGCIMAQMSNPSMKLPIQLALTYPKRFPLDVKPMDFSRPLDLHFEPLHEYYYPLFYLGMKYIKRGGIYPCAVNACSEAMVQAYIDGEIQFTDMYFVMSTVLRRVAYEDVTTYERLEWINRSVRGLTKRTIMNQFCKRNYLE